MADLLIDFVIELGNGPLFHRWLPNSDSKIELQVDTGHVQLWFEKRGYTDTNMVRFDFNRHEVDDAIVQKQGKLMAGPLFGRLRIKNISANDLDVLKNDRVGDEGYVQLGKAAVRSIISVLERLTRLLRERYGQHWLEESQAWDSRYLSLGAFCNKWKMRWSDDEGTHWHPFKPDKFRSSTGPIPGTKFSEYLTQADWTDLKLAVEKKEEPSLTAQLLANSNRLLSNREFRMAVIEAVSALEVAVSEAITKAVAGSEKLANAVAPFLNDSPLSSRMIVLSSLIGGIDQKVIETALEAIELRNKVVHEGAWAEHKHADQIRAVLEVGAKLVPGPRIKFPVLTANNALADSSDWDKTGGYSPIVTAGGMVTEA